MADSIPESKQRMSATYRASLKGVLDSRHPSEPTQDYRDLIDALHDLDRVEAERDAARAELDTAYQLIDRILDDFAYLQRSYHGSLYTTGAGYTLEPRVLELRAYRASKAEVAALLTEEQPQKETTNAH